MEFWQEVQLRANGSRQKDCLKSAFDLFHNVVWCVSPQYCGSVFHTGILFQNNWLIWPKAIARRILLNSIHSRKLSNYRKENIIKCMECFNTVVKSLMCHVTHTLWKFLPRLAIIALPTELTQICGGITKRYTYDISRWCLKSQFAVKGRNLTKPQDNF